MSCSRTCLKGAVVVGLIAALTPGLWAQSLQQETRTVSGERSAGSVPIEAQRTLPGLESKLSDMAASATRTVAPPTEAAAGFLLEGLVDGAHSPGRDGPLDAVLSDALGNARSAERSLLLERFRRL